jgi:hypothetical protein
MVIPKEAIMTTPTTGRSPRNRGRKFSFEQVLEAAKSLPLGDQRRLREELAKTEQVYLAQPNPSEKAIQHGQKLAEEVRSETNDTGETLDEAMSRLRGRKWSS